LDADALSSVQKCGRGRILYARYAAAYRHHVQTARRAAPRTARMVMPVKFGAI
jgi:hypothetical protein